MSSGDSLFVDQYDLDSGQKFTALRVSGESVSNDYCRSIENWNGVQCDVQFGRVLLFIKEQNIGESVTVTLPGIMKYLIIFRSTESLADQIGFAFVPVGSVHAELDLESIQHSLKMQLFDDPSVSSVVVKVKSGINYSITKDDVLISTQTHIEGSSVLDFLTACGDHIVSSVDDFMYLFLDTSCIITIKHTPSLAFIMDFDQIIQDSSSFLQTTLSELREQLNVSDGINLVSLDKNKGRLKLSMSEEAKQSLVLDPLLSETKSEELISSLLSNLDLTFELASVKKDAEEVLPPAPPVIAIPDPVDKGDTETTSAEKANTVLIAVIVVGSVLFVGGAVLGVWKMSVWLKAVWTGKGL